jgi:Ca2+-binding RTX toxin-like protein
VSFVIAPTNGTIFAVTDPSALALGFAGGGTNPSTGLVVPGLTTDTTSSPQTPPFPVLGGVSQTYNIVMPSGQVANFAITGTGTFVNITGSANIVATNSGGGGAIIETPNSTTDFGTKVISLEGNFDPPTANTSVNLNALVGNNQGTGQITIAEAAGNQGGDYLFYVHGGAGNDFIVGSGYNDFIRGGGGDDSINASGGNDLIRGGAGSDQINLGLGSDTVYYTLDQVQYGDGGELFDAPVSLDKLYIDTVTDFTAGADKVSFGPAFGLTDDSNKVSGIGTNTLTIANTSGTTVGKVISGKDAFNASDINFI